MRRKNEIASRKKNPWLFFQTLYLASIIAIYVDDSFWMWHIAVITITVDITLVKALLSTNVVDVAMQAKECIYTINHIKAKRDVVVFIYSVYTMHASEIQYYVYRKVVLMKGKKTAFT